MIAIPLMVVVDIIPPDKVDLRVRQQERQQTRNVDAYTTSVVYTEVMVVERV